MEKTSESDRSLMAYALELAVRGQGQVEPNPMVGCVIAKEGRIIGQGWHKEFGSPHAEIVALQDAGSAAKGASLYVTLEPCCHQGKTGPCTRAIIDAGITRVVVAHRDPFPEVDGGGIAALEAAGILCDQGLMEEESAFLLAPYLKLVTAGKPWVIAKWAMTLDGKIATRTGDSQWISNEQSREVVHKLRSRVDAIMVGSGTAQQDDPLLTARPSASEDVHRVATRIVLDSQCTLASDSQLATTTDLAPLVVATSSEAKQERCVELTQQGVEIFTCAGETQREQLIALLDELGQRRMTNILVEGGSQIFGLLFDLGSIDEVHIFIAPKLIGGGDALSPIGGQGIEKIANVLPLDKLAMEKLGNNMHINGRISKMY